MNKKIALPINDSFIVIVLDFACKLLIVDIESGTITKKNIVNLNESFSSLKAKRLKDLQVNTVLCSAVSDPLALMICHYGIEVLPGLNGNTDQLLDAFVTGKLMQFHAPDFQPGFKKCCGYRIRRRFRGGRKVE